MSSHIIPAKRIVQCDFCDLVETLPANFDGAFAPRRSVGELCYSFTVPGGATTHDQRNDCCAACAVRITKELDRIISESKS